MAAVCAGVVVARVGAERREAGVRLLAAGLGLVTVADTTSWLLVHRFGAVAKIWQAAPAGVLSTNELLTRGGAGITPTWSWWWLAVAAPRTGTHLS